MSLTWTVRGTVTHVVDGDTFDCDLDLGWGIWIRRAPNKLGRIRVLDMNAPELSTPEGVEAKTKAEALLPIGSKVWIQSTDLDHFGRCLAKVTLDDGRDFATVMGFPIAATVKP